MVLELFAWSLSHLTFSNICTYENAQFAILCATFIARKSASIPNSTQYRSKIMMDRVERKYSESVLNTWLCDLFQPTVFNLNVARITFKNMIIEIDRLLLPPACYYTSAMPVSLRPTQVTAWLCVKMYTSIEHDFCTTCYERPSVLRDCFCWSEGVVPQDRFYGKYLPL